MVSDGGQTAPEPWLTYTAAGCNVGGVSAANIELENNTSIAITSLSAASLVSDTTIKVGSVAAMAPGQVLTIDTGAATETATIASVGTAGATGTGVTLTAPLTIAHATGARVYGVDPTGDMTRVFGQGSPEWNEGRDSQLATFGSAAFNLAQTDFVGIAIHCAQGQAPARGTRTRSPTTRRSTPAPTTATRRSSAPSTSTRRSGRRADANGRPCIKATDGSNITDPTNQCGFPGFDGALAKNTLGEVAQMQEHGVPVTFAYISDAHDDHTLAQASGPGEAGYQQQLADYDAAFDAFFKRLDADGINKSNTLFVVTVDEGDHFAGGTGIARPGEPGCAHLHAPALPGHGGDADVPVEPDRRDHDEPESAAPGDRAAVQRAQRRCPDDLRQQPAEPNRSIRSAAGAGHRQRNGDRPVPGRRLHPDHRQPRRPGRGRSAPHGHRRPEADADADALRAGRLLLPDRELRHVLAVARRVRRPEVRLEPRRRPAGDRNTWLAMVGPGVDNNGVDDQTWTDHVDLHADDARAPRPAGSLRRRRPGDHADRRATRPSRTRSTSTTRTSRSWARSTSRSTRRSAASAWTR